MTVGALVTAATTQLHHSSRIPRLDAEVLLAFVLKKNRTFIFAHADETVAPDARRKYMHLVAQRRRGLPIAYLTGTKEFYGREFFVNSSVLIPRPETELLVEEVLASVAQYQFATPRILDIGTGSGCIAVTLKKEFGRAQIFATDISDAALAVAKQNTKHHSADISFFSGDCFATLPKKTRASFHCIVANPPYLSAKNLPDILETRSLRFEPRTALFPPDENNALEIIQRILTDAQLWLHAHEPHGLFIEIGAEQGNEVQDFAQRCFPHHNISIKKDHTGFDRILIVASVPPSPPFQAVSLKRGRGLFTLIQKEKAGNPCGARDPAFSSVTCPPSSSAEAEVYLPPDLSHVYRDVRRGETHLQLATSP